MTTYAENAVEMNRERLRETAERLADTWDEIDRLERRLDALENGPSENPMPYVETERVLTEYYERVTELEDRLDRIHSNLANLDAYDGGDGE